MKSSHRKPRPARAGLALACAAIAAFALPNPAFADVPYSAWAWAYNGTGDAGFGQAQASFAWNYDVAGGASHSYSPLFSSGDAQGSATQAMAAVATTVGSISSQSFARGDLATGTVRASNVSSAVGAGQYSTGAGRAFIQDLLTFTAAPGAESTAVGVTFTIDGRMLGLGASPQRTGAMEGDFTLGGKDARGFMGLNAGSGFVAQAWGDTYPSGWDGVWTITGTPDAQTLTFHGDYVFNGASATVPLTMKLDVNCGDGMLCDYSHTAAVALSLPGGASYSSASGVFLSQAVPEPGAWALMALGLGVLGWRGRRHMPA